MSKCLNQDADTLQYCGKPEGHAGVHMNMHSLMQWAATPDNRLENLTLVRIK